MPCSATHYPGGDLPKDKGNSIGSVGIMSVSTSFPILLNQGQGSEEGTSLCSKDIWTRSYGSTGVVEEQGCCKSDDEEEQALLRSRRRAELSRLLKISKAITRAIFYLVLLAFGLVATILAMSIINGSSIPSHGPYIQAPATSFYPSAARQHVLSADQAGHQIWPSRLSQKERELVDRFTPFIKVHSEEEFYPSSIDHLLGHFFRLTTRDGEDVRTAGNATSPRLDQNNGSRQDSSFPLDRSTLPLVPMSGKGLWLDLAEPHNAQPGFPDESSAYLYGPGGATAKDRRERNSLVSAGPGSALVKGRVIREPVYTFYVDKGEGIVDLFYWTFHPYNLGKKVAFLGYVGNHIGDWEHVRVRTVNGTGHSVDFSVHRNLQTGTWRWADVEKRDGRPVAYSAKGSHGLWPTAGPQVYHSALFGLFNLVDHTDDRGTLWDPIAETVSWQPVPGNRWGGPRYDMGGKSAWLNYGGRWGGPGSSSCWFWKFGHTCAMADSPVGPNRWFGGPPKCIIGPLRPSSSRRSRATLKLDRSALAFAHNHNLTHVRAEPICSDSSGWREAPRVVDGASLLPPVVENGLFDDRLGGRVALEGMDRTAFVLEFDACPTAGWRRTYLTGYKLYLCEEPKGVEAAGRCSYGSPARDICTFLPSDDDVSGLTHSGYTSGQSVELVDTDPWSWLYEGGFIPDPASEEQGDHPDWRASLRSGLEWASMTYVYVSAYFEVFWR